VQKELRRDEIICREVAGQRYVTTKEVLREERAMVAAVRDGRGTTPQAGRCETRRARPEFNPPSRAKQGS